MGTAIFIIFMSITSFIISFMQFKEKGFLFNNAYIFASENEREKMDKKPHYRQSGIVFLLIGVMFLLMAIEFIVKAKWIWIAEGITAAAVLIYAIVSSVKIDR